MVSNDQVFDRLEAAAIGALDDYMSYRAYQGENPDYYKRARMGIPVLSTYGRVRGTRANERQLDILERRFASGEAGDGQAMALAGQSDHALPAVSVLPNAHATDEAAGAARTRRGNR